jgi:sodium-dependent phosphate cotransporter
MGANIGTSVTSTIVCLGQVQDSDEFRRAFAAATIHDMFNFLTVAVLLPLEAATGYLFHLSKAIISSYTTLTSQDKPPDMLKVITKPFTKFVMQVDKKLISKIAAETNSTILAELNAKSLLKKPDDKVSYIFDGMYGNWSDSAAGTFMLFFSLTIMCITLYAIVALLRSLLKGRIAVWLHRVVNQDVPDLHTIEEHNGEIRVGRTIPMGWLSGYLAMGVGMGLTIMVQSSSITTAALTPLVGVGVIRLERMYPTVLGANIGTTITGVLAALAASGDKLQYTLQVAYAHLFFNISGIVLFYVIPTFRHVPLKMAQALGNLTVRYKWYPLFYIFIAFLVIPAIFTLLGMAGDAVVLTVFLLLVAFILAVYAINYLQDNQPEKLPAGLRNWDFLPLAFRSLEPIDNALCKPLVSAFKRTCGCCFAEDKAQIEKVMVKSDEILPAPSTDALKKAEDRLSTGADKNQV